MRGERERETLHLILFIPQKNLNPVQKFVVSNKTELTSP